jgi:aspartate/methionine/tyrosine aminotransferase
MTASLKFAARGRIPPFIAMDVMRDAYRLAAEGADVVHMEVGQPSTAAPSKVREAAARALSEDVLGYTEGLGLPALRARIARHYREFYGVAVDAERVVVTGGASGAFLLAFLAAFSVGDRVVLVSPGYPAYRHILSALGVEVVDVAAGPEDRFQPTPALLDRVQGRIDGVIVASPSNPTGTMLGRSDLTALIDWCRRHGARLVSDEIYHGLTYGEPAETVAGLSGDAIVINSFSKYFSMTGWRLGWMIVPEDLAPSIGCLAQNFVISPPTLSQLAAVSAFECHDELQANLRRYAENRAILLEGLPRCGIDNFLAPQGAFYLYADIGNLTNDSLEFCRRMLRETGVAATPGLDFDAARGHRALRFSFAGETARIIEAVRRLRTWR